MRIPLNPQSTYILRQIIAPAVRFVRPLLGKAGFDKNTIVYSGLDKFPNVHVDCGLMTQVVFNLLDNAIKYYQGDPAHFSIEIEGSVSTWWLRGALSRYGHRGRGWGREDYLRPRRPWP